MKRKHACQALTMIVLVCIFIELPAAAYFQGESSQQIFDGMIKTSQQLETEDIEIVVGMPGSFDINEPIYAVASVIRNAKAAYVKPVSMKFEIYSTEFGDKFVIGTNFGKYEGSNWVSVNEAEVQRLNDFVYYTKFVPFAFEASLIMRVTVEWLSPWRQVLTKTTEQAFGIGEWYNVTNKVSATRDRIQSSVLGKVDLSVGFSGTLMDNIVSGLQGVGAIVTQITELMSQAAIDPAGFNFYVVDLIGNSTNPGPMYNIVKQDLYSHLSSGSRDVAMDARHQYIMNSIKQSLLPIKAKFGMDTDASDGEYSYTVTFIRKIYEAYAPDSAYLNPSTTVDTFNSIVYSDKYGNVTGTSWDTAYSATSGLGKASLEFMLEPLTGAHPKFKSPLGAAHNSRAVGKGVVLNTMGAYFPVMNSWYDYYETASSDRPSSVVRTGAQQPNLNIMDDESRLVLDDSNPMINIRRLALYYNQADTNFVGSALLPNDGNDIFDNFTSYEYPSFISAYHKTSAVPLLRYGIYIHRLATGMTGNFYNWINVGGGKPFSKFTRDNHIANAIPANLQISDGTDDLILEMEGSTCYTSYWNGATFDVRSYPSQWANLTTFKALDSMLGLTNDQIRHTIDSKPIGFTNTEYYKTDVGRWIDAFFNGTDLSLRDGKLGSANYITAAQDTSINVSGDVFYSPKANHYSFSYEDVYVFHKLGRLSNYNIPNEYSWAPFVGPNPQVPVGWMISSDMWYSVVGTDDIAMALEYLYGGIVMGYKETTLKYKSLALGPVYLGYQCGISESKITYLVQQAADLDAAWAALDFREIDVIGTRILSAIAPNRTDVKEDVMFQTIDRLKNFTTLAYSLVAKDQSDYSYIDTGLDTAGSDLSVGAVGEALNKLLSGDIPDALAYLQKTFATTMSFLTTAKNRTFNSAISIANSLGDMVFGALNASLAFTADVSQKVALGLETVGDRIVKVSTAMNETLTTNINALAGWTKDQVDNLATATDSAVTGIANFINDTVIEGIRTVNNQIAGAISTVINKTEEIVTEVGAAVGGTVEAIGAGLGVAGAVTLGVGIGTLNPGAAIAGGAMYAIGLGAVEAGQWITETSAAVATGAADLARKALTIANGAANSVLDAAKQGTGIVLDFARGAIYTARDYTNTAIDFTANVATNVVGDLTNFAQGVGSTIGTMGQRVRDTSQGIQQVLQNGLTKVYTWTKQSMESITESIIENARSIAYAIESNIRNIITLVNLTNSILSEVQDKFEELVNGINSAFDQIGALFEATASFLIDLAGTAIDLTVDFSTGIASQLQAVENQLASSSGFYQLINPLLQEVRDSRVAASLIEYASQTIGVTKEILFKWKDVIQPVSRIQGADSSFRLYQMGNKISQKMYFVTVYQGELVAVNNITLKASRIPEQGESVPGGLLEANIPLFLERYSNGSFINGLYYASFTSSDSYQWFGNTTAPLKTEAPRPASYLTRSDASYTTPISSPHEGKVFNITWIDETEYFNSSFTEDAFPIVSIVSTYTDAITGGDTVPLVLSIQNDMFSKPVVEIQYSISTPTGFVIANRRIGNVVLPSSDDGAVAFNFEFTPLSTTPAGTYDLLVSVVEQNGDTATVVTSVTIRGKTIFEEFLGFIIGLIGSVLGFFGLGAFISTKRKPSSKNLDNIAGVFGAMRFDVPSGCSIDDVSSGKCSINGVNLSCDADLGTCKFDL